MSTSSATPEFAAPLHAGRVIFPTVARAHASRAAHGASLVRGATTAALVAHGGTDGIEVTTGTPKVYLVFYGSQWGTETTTGGYDSFSGDPVGMAPRLQALLSGIGTNNELWSGVMTQYCDGLANGASVCPTGAAHVGYPTGGALAGVWYDNSVAAPSSATGHQLAVEAVAAAAHFANLTAASNRSAQYVIVSPTGTHPDGFNTPSGTFCAYHDYNGDTTLSGGGAAASSYGDIAFTNLPYVTDMGTSCGMNYVNGGSAGTLDGVTIVEGHEYAETLSDQNAGGGWWDNTNGYENGDLCAWVGRGGTGGAQNVTFATGSFAMQATWSNATNGCAISGPIVTGAAPGNDFSLAVSPTSASVQQGSGTSATVSTATISGSSQTVSLSVSGLPSGASATLTPSTLTSGSSSTLAVTTSSTTPTGTYAVTVTGTATSGTHTATFSLTVTAPVVPGTFSLAASPSSGTVALGRSISTTVITSTLSGSAQTVSLSISGLPSGVSASFTPASVTSGGSSTLRLTVSRRSLAGTYTLTITGKGPSYTTTTTYKLTD